jgi:hypothetical protein
MENSSIVAPHLLSALRAKQHSLFLPTTLAPYQITSGCQIRKIRKSTKSPLENEI